MRLDYGLYIVAVAWFIIVGLVLSEGVQQWLPDPMTFEGTVVTVISAALGLIFAILGYALRPKPVISPPEVSKPNIQLTRPAVLPPVEEAPASLPLNPAPALPQHENAQPAGKNPNRKTRRQRTKKRRKKT